MLSKQKKKDCVVDPSEPQMRTRPLRRPHETHSGQTTGPEPQKFQKFTPPKSVRFLITIPIRIDVFLARRGVPTPLSGVVKREKPRVLGTGPANSCRSMQERQDNCQTHHLYEYPGNFPCPPPLPLLQQKNNADPTPP